MDRKPTRFNNKLSSEETKRMPADKIHSILKASRTDTDSSLLPDRGDIFKKTTRLTDPKKMLASVAKMVFEEGKMPTVNRCSSIGDVGDDCAIKTASKKLRPVKQRAAPKPNACNGLCRDKCRITFEERQRLRQRYTFRLKPHVTFEEEDKVVQEEDFENVANRLKHYYLPNDKTLDVPQQRRMPNASCPPKGKPVSSTERSIRYRTLQARPEPRPTKLSKSTSPVKLNSMHSKVSIKTKRHKPKKKVVNARCSSPELANSCMSPPTEIARWIPDASSLHAKPYYDAWVSTTLAAFSQQQNDDLYREKKDIVQRLKKNFETVHNTQSLLTNSRCRLHDEQNFASFLTDPPVLDEAVVGRIRIKR